jgi:DNA polymerase (family 10)
MIGTEVSQPGLLSNAEIADRLSALAQLLTIEKANPYKIRAYRRAAVVIRGLGESVDELVRSNEDLRVYAGIGEAISGAIREIVETGSLKMLEKLRSNHTPSLKIANGQLLEDLGAQIRAIDQLNSRFTNFRVLKSAEVDILADGALDLPNDLLRELDYTVCSIHSRFAMNREKQTERVLRAMDNPYFTILGHATGRLLLKRPGYELDLERLVEHAKHRGLFFELNSSPDRLDVSAENARLVRVAGIKIAISTDSHGTGEYQTIRYGLEQARRAGLGKLNVLNCQPLTELLRLFKRS